MKSGKSKGNAFENKIAKQLGIWMFSDPDMFTRSITSGAKKTVYLGDVVPQKRLPNTFNNGEWPFLIECKNGYKNFIPNLNNQNIIRQWLNKICIDQDINKNQNIIYLIVNFHGYSPLLITNKILNKSVIIADLILNLIFNDKIIEFYIYKFNDVISIPFNNIYNELKYNI